MEAVKEKLINAITIMNYDEAISLWEYLTRTQNQKNIWNSLEEAEPTEEEAKILEAYEHGDSRYQPHISHEELKRKLGIG